MLEARLSFGIYGVVLDTGITEAFWDFNTNYIPSEIDERIEADETEYVSFSIDLESMRLDDVVWSGESLTVMMIVGWYRLLPRESERVWYSMDTDD